MPIYEYKCSSCDNSFEERQGFDAEATCPCPTCQNKAIRVIQAPPIIFKGSGFYVTDHRNGASCTSQTPSSDSSESEKPESTTPATATAAPSDD